MCAWAPSHSKPPTRTPNSNPQSVTQPYFPALYSHALLAAPTRAPSPLVFEDKLEEQSQEEEEDEREGQVGGEGEGKGEGGGEGEGGVGEGEGVGGGAVERSDLGKTVYPQVAIALGYSWPSGLPSIYPEANDESSDVPRPSWALSTSTSALALRVSRVDSGEDLSLLCSIVQVRTRASARDCCTPVARFSNVRRFILLPPFPLARPQPHAHVPTLVQRLPEPNHRVARALFAFLERVAKAEPNLMTAGALAVVFAPSLLRPPSFAVAAGNEAAGGVVVPDVGVQVMEAKRGVVVVECLIVHHATIFGTEP